MKRLRFLFAAALLVPAVPAAATTSATADRRAELPSQLSASERKDYREVFAAIDEGDWAGAAAKLDSMREGPLHSAALAELYLAKGSPRVELPQILPLLRSAPEMPKAGQLRRLAETRGGTDLPPVVEPQKLYWAGSQPRRERPDAVRGDPVAAEIGPQIQPLIVDDQPAAAEAILVQRERELSREALTELRQRVAWSHYLVGNDVAARDLAMKAVREGGGEWLVHAQWVAGLASWRMHDCKDAAQSFAGVAARSNDPELIAAGHYWASRAEMACGRPDLVQASLRKAAHLRETFYGLLAASALGIKTPNYSGLHDYSDAEWREVVSRPNVKTAIALSEIGEIGLAEEYIEHQARLGGARDHEALLHVAQDLDLASTQFWLAHNAPRGASVNLSARYPMPDWKPTGGWRVEKPLIYAHALQESSFRERVVSGAGAVGLLQVRPGTAGDIARSRGQGFSPKQLTEPATNIEYGQSYIEYLRDYPATDGLLLKVIAAYNCGPAPVARWDEQRMANGDPLLYIESLPYWETRGYVPIVLRNYWIYEQKAGKSSASRNALAQGMWPRFPGLPGPQAVRMQPQRSYATASASN